MVPIPRYEVREMRSRQRARYGFAAPASKEARAGSLVQLRQCCVAARGLFLPDPTRVRDTFGMSRRRSGLIEPLDVLGLVAAGFLALGCQRSCPCPATAATSSGMAGTDREARAPGPRSQMNDEEAWYHDHYNQVAAVDVQYGKATYYGESLAGNHTANGEIFEPSRFTAAHRALPFGTVVRVVRLDTGAHTYVRINDRGPFGDSRRIIDLAKVAASRLDMLRAGVVNVRVEILRWGDGRTQKVAHR